MKTIVLKYKINQFVNEVAAKEQELMPDVLMAEIAHLPDSRDENGNPYPNECIVSFYKNPEK